MTKKEKVEKIKYDVPDFEEQMKVQGDLELSRRFFETYKIKKSGASVPNYAPKNFYEQFYLYKNGATYRLYININNDWKYIALT